MALAEIPQFEIHELANEVSEIIPRGFIFTRSDSNQKYFDDEKPIEIVEDELESRFSYDRITNLTESYLIEKLGDNWKDLVGTRRFVALIPAISDYKDLGAFVETTRFSRKFERPSSQIYQEYSEYDSTSLFAVVIDTTIDTPFPVGSLRMTLPDNNKDFKSVYDFLGVKENNPWLDEVKGSYFSVNEDYDVALAWERIVDATADRVRLDETIDVPTLAVLEEYASNGSEYGVSLALYHTCMQFARSHGFKNVLSIQDLKPLEILQAFGNPFDTFPEISPKINEGKYPGIPAYCIVERALERILNSDRGVGEMFVDGKGLENDYMFVETYDPSMIIKTKRVGSTALKPVA